MTEEKKTTKKVEAQKKSEVQKKQEVQDNQEFHFATAKSLNLPMSTKQSYEVANYLRGRNLQKAKMLLQQVLDKKTAVPYKRFNRDTGHKPGIAAGRYPEKVSKAFLMLLNSVEANAEDKGLDNEKLIISEIRSTQGSQQWHAGRQRRRRMKRTHIYVKVEESEK
jgi:large subunit ribosomal protein L22